MTLYSFSFFWKTKLIIFTPYPPPPPFILSALSSSSQISSQIFLFNWKHRYPNHVCASWLGLSCFYRTKYLSKTSAQIHFIGFIEAADPVVGTIPSVTLKEGSEAELKCEYERDALAVFWKYGFDYQTADRVVILDLQNQKGEKSGPGYASGRFDITDEFSLVIVEVRVEDEGRYYCEVSDNELGVVFRNHTDVKVGG